MTTVSFNFDNNILHNSVVNGHLNTVQRLISSGSCDPNLPHSITGLRPIHFAASRGHVDLVQFLVQSTQVQIDSIDKEGETALLKAAYAGHLSVVQYLVESNANHLHQDRDGWTALHNACSFGNLKLVEYLVNLPNVNVNVTSIQGHTPLMNAASKGYLDIVKYLLNFANPLIKNKFGETAYDVAAAAGEAYLCQMIEQYEFKWHNPLLPYNSLDMHVTIPVLLVEEQHIEIIPSSSSSFMTTTKKKNIIIGNSIWYFKGQEITNKSKVDLPNTNWFWLSDWTIDQTIPRIKNDEGWSFTTNHIEEDDDNNCYSEIPTTITVEDSSWIKRRQWIRIMKKVVDTTEEESIRHYNYRDSTSSTSSSSDSESDSDSDLEQRQRQSKNKSLTSVSTTMTKAQSVFIASHTTQPLLQEQITATWENNEQVLNCRRCHKYFNLIIRRHHCRKCGQIICNQCSTQRVYLPPNDIIQPPTISDLHLISMQPQRICDLCVKDVYIIKKKKKRSSSMMIECPVCTKNLLMEYNTKQEQEQHVQSCLNNGSHNIGIRFVVYKLTENSTLIGQECVICFEEFEYNDTITRLNCMCSYHSHCINNWFSKGKECPIHSQ